MQFSTMPTASADTVGKIIQYTGTTDANYTNGYFYIGTSETETVDNEEVTTYSWESLNVQPAGQVGINKYEVNITTDCLTTTGSNNRQLNSTDKSAFSAFVAWANTQTEDFYLQINLVNQPKSYIRTPGSEWLGVDSRLSGDFYNVFTKKYAAGTNFSNGEYFQFVITGHSNGCLLPDAHGTTNVRSYSAITTASVYYRSSNNYGELAVCNELLGVAAISHYLSYYALTKTNTTAYTPSGDYNPATKKYVDDAVSGAGGGGNANINYYTLTSDVDITSVTSDLTYSEPNKTNVELNDTYTEMSTIINEAYQNGIEAVGIILLDKKWNIPFINCNLLRGALGIQSKPTTMYLSAPYVSTYGITGINQDTAVTIAMPRLTITMSWTGDVCTVTGVKYTWTSINAPALTNVLTKDNNTSYTPSADYHPATKKYVDDKTTLIEPFYCALLTKLEYKTTGSDSTINTTDAKTRLGNALTQAATDNFRAPNIILYGEEGVSPNNYHRAIAYYRNRPISEHPTTIYYDCFYPGDETGSNAPNTWYCKTLKLSCSWSGNTCTVSNIDSYYNGLDARYLATNNTTAYTPSSNYHPATKKYVDDNTHTHTNKTLLDTLTAGDVSDWNSAVTNSHSHTNKTVLDGISSSDITNWNKTHIYSGTSTPGAGTGENGDIYVKYTA